MKVFGTETLDFVADEALQMLGGYGFIDEYPLERHYRDSRINRIFEGTNEINRLIIPATLMKRVDAGRPAVLRVPAAGRAEEIAEVAAPAARHARARSARRSRPARWRSAWSPTPRSAHPARARLAAGQAAAPR